MFWVTDNFLMRKTYKKYQRESGFLKKVKVKYHRIKKDKVLDEEFDDLESADEELIGSEDVSITLRSNGVTIT